MNWQPGERDGAGEEPGQDPGLPGDRTADPGASPDRSAGAGPAGDDAAGDRPAGDGTAEPQDPGLAGFAAGGLWGSRPPSAAMAAALEGAAGEGWRCEGGSREQIVGAVRAAAALESWSSAAKLGLLRAAIREDDPGLPGRGRHGDLPDEWSRSLTHDVALALAMSPISAGNLLQTAWDLGALLPGIGALLEDGTLTYPKARAVNDALALLSEEDRAAAEAMIAPRLAGKTFGQVDKIAALAAVTVDPDHAERTREHAERNRARVILKRERSGAAMLSGYDLPPADTLAAHAAVCARAEEYKASGAFPGVLTDQLRAMAYLDMMNGISAGARIAAGPPEVGLGAPGEGAFRDEPEPDDPGAAAPPGSGGSDCPCDECDGRCAPAADDPGPGDDVPDDDVPDDDEPDDDGPEDDGPEDGGFDGPSGGRPAGGIDPGPGPDAGGGGGNPDPAGSGPGCHCRACDGHCLPADDVVGRGNADPDEVRADDAGLDDAGLDDAGPDSGSGPEDDKTHGPDSGPPRRRPPPAPPPPPTSRPSPPPLPQSPAQSPQSRSSPWSASPLSPAPPKPIDLAIPLATLLGPRRRPGESHGFGTLDPALCRALAALAAASPHTTACVTVTDENGHAIGHGCLRAGRRNGPLPGAPPAPLTALPARLNLTVTATRLVELAGNADPHPRPAPPGLALRSGWALASHPTTDPRGRSGDPPWCGTWIITLPSGLHYTARLEPVPTHDCDHRRESHAYKPNDALRHLVQIRDHECTFPTCSRHAKESDFEHAIPYHQGGRTCGCNAGARSRACHQVKQSPGWTVTQPKPGWHQWQTPSGRTYTQEPKRYPA